MNQFKVGCAIVRIHRSTDQEKLKQASERFMKKVYKQRKEKKQ